ncbi:MAG: YceI family protein [Acidimicrobiales bacterium]
MADLSALTPGTWNVDAAHSRVGFTVRHLMVSKVRGSFTTFSGAVTVGEDKLASSVVAEVQMASIATGDDNRDNHLRTGDFFDVAAHPTMTFRSTGITADGGDYVLAGELTIKGITKPVTFELEFEGVSPDPWGGTRAGFSAETEISRKEWGLEYNAVLETGGVVISDKVKLELDIQVVKVG